MSRVVLFVVGTRPNFVKAAPVIGALFRRPGIEIRVLHTGQHYDRALSETFLQQLDFPNVDYHLGVGAGTHAEQTAAVLVGVERVLAQNDFDATVVSGDVNSTLGAALAAAKLRVPVVHIESGLRSHDWTMPEEINRVLVDRLSDLLLCHSREAVSNLACEGIARERVALVGNTMIDSLLNLLPTIDCAAVLSRHGLEAENYVLATFHRPSLVDDAARLDATLEVLEEVARTWPVVLPLHPRTRAQLAGRLRTGSRSLTLTEPLDYRTFIALESSARLVITDSGGVQEETSALGIRCLTYRTSTERAITVERGSNRLIGVDPAALRQACAEELASSAPAAPAPIPLWDGKSGPRAADAIEAMLQNGRSRLLRFATSLT